MLLGIYAEHVEGGNYWFEHAETIASNMAEVFLADHIGGSLKAKALGLAITGAIKMHRFAAMGICKRLIRDIKDNDLAHHVMQLIVDSKGTFVGDIEPSECSNTIIQGAIASIRNQ